MSDKANRKATAKAPVSAHPAFPAIVALWFAALFGIGSLVLPAALYERTFEATGFAALFTAAQAPLGVTARIAIALTAAVLGVIAGLAIARQVAAASKPRTISRRAAKLNPLAAAATNNAKRPISAHEEFGFGGIDSEAGQETGREAATGRRRALSVTDESARSDFLEFAPLPGQDDYYGADEPAALDLAPFAPVNEAAEGEAAEASTEIEPIEPIGFGSAGLSGPPAASAFAMPGQIEDTEMAEPQPAPIAFTTPAREAPARQEFVAPAARPTPVFAPAAAGQPGIAELVARFARALDGHRAAQGEAESAAQAPLTPPIPVAFDETAIEEDGRAAFAAAPHAFATPEAEPPVPHIPLALRPVGFDDADDSDDAIPDLDLTSALAGGSRGFAVPTGFEPEPAEVEAPAPVASSEAEDASEDESIDEGYSSLLAMKSPFGLPREPVRIEEDEDDDGIEPVVVFPGQAVRGAAVPATDGPARDAVAHVAASRPFDAPQMRADALANGGAVAHPAKRADAGETERALREALDKLQRMSGLG